VEQVTKRHVYKVKCSERCLVVCNLDAMQDAIGWMERGSRDYSKAPTVEFDAMLSGLLNMMGSMIVSAVI
jgi:hypothetical protein